VRFEVLNPPVHGYKYRLTASYTHILRYYQPETFAQLKGGWVTINSAMLFLKNGYMWDGGSGPAIDTMNTALATLVHDSLYQLIAAEKLPKRTWKQNADREFYHLLRKANVPIWRAAYMYLAVTLFGGARGVYKP
jgi:hypothetical protein